jgi:hypothetical protein
MDSPASPTQPNKPNPSSGDSAVPLEAPSRRLSRSTLWHGLALGLLVIGGALYWFVKPPSLNLLADPASAEALALVQTHRAKQAPTLLQGVNEIARLRGERGVKTRLGQWTVEKEGENLYIVKVMFREQGSRNWVEREYTWHVDLKGKKISALSMPAIDLMPEEDLAPLNPAMPLPVR